MFQRAGYSVQGYEYSKSQVLAGREFELNILEGGVSEAEGQYDVVIVNQVLEHVPEFVSFVTHLKRLMKPDGILYVGVPNIEVYGPGQFQNAHCYYFSRPTLAHYMGLQGLFADTLPAYIGVAFHGLFTQRAGTIYPLENEYQRMKAVVSQRHWRVVLMNTAHHLSTYIPG